MKLKEKIPYIFLIILALSLLLFCLSSAFSATTSIINRTVCTPLRNTLSYFTSPFPFSVFEALVIFSPILIFLSVIYILRGREDFRKRFFLLIGILSLFPSLYILTLGISYKSTAISEKYGNGPAESSEIFQATKMLVYDINELGDVSKDSPTLAEIAEDLSKSYDKILHGYGLEDVFLPKPKPLLSSPLMSRLGILALYSFPTGEVNLNTDIPEYMIPFTLAHEYAHTLGAASEADANFLAYIACTCVENPYIRYSGTLSILEYFLADISRYNKEIYSEVYKEIPPFAIFDISLYRKYYNKYKDTFLFTASDKINSAHLDAWDPHGALSYSAVTVYVTHYLNSA